MANCANNLRKQLNCYGAQAQVNIFGAGGAGRCHRLRSAGDWVFGCTIACFCILPLDIQVSGHDHDTATCEFPGPLALNSGDRLGESPSSSILRLHALILLESS